MDYITAPGTEIDSEGRPQFADKVPGSVQGTDLCAAVFNPTINELVGAIIQSGQAKSSSDETQIATAMTILGNPPVWTVSLADKIKGFPFGFIVTDPTVNSICWRSTANNNMTTPGASGASWVSVSAGRFLASHIILSSQTFTPLATTRYLRVRMIGGGGSGGGAAANASGGNGVSCGAAGATGAYCEFLIDLASLGVSSFALSVGAAGSGNVGGQGGQGGATSFDNRIICNGGQGGRVSGSVASGVAISVSQSAGGAVDVVNSAGMSGVLAYDGQNGSSALIVSNGSGNVGIPNPPEGASSPLGSGGGNAIGGPPTKVATGLGASGGAAASNTATAYAGGDGAQGGFLIEEYSA